MPTVDIKRAGTDLQRRIAPNNQQFVQTEDLSYLDAVQEQAAKWKQAEDLNYVANSTTELQKQIHETSKQLEQEFFNNPEGYTQAHEQATAGLYKSAIDNAPSPEARNQMLVQAEQTKRFNLNNAVAWEQTNTVARYQERHDAAITDITNMLADSPNERQYQEMRALMEAENLAAEQHLSPAAHVELVKRNQRALDKTYITSTAQSNPSAARELLNSGRFDEVFEASEQQTLNNSIDAVENKLRVEADRREALRIQTKSDQFKQSLFTAETADDVGLLITEITDSVKNDPEFLDEGIKLMNFAKTFHKQKLERQSNIDAVQGALGSGMPVKDEKALDDGLMWLASSEKFANLETEEEKIFAAAEEIVQKTGQVPPSLRTSLQNSLVSSNPKAAAAAAQTVVKFLSLNDFAGRKFSDAEKAMAYDISQHIDTGVAPDVAVELIQKKQASTNIPQDQALNAEFNTLTEEIDELIESEYDLELPAPMKAQYKERMRENYVLRKMDLRTASAAAKSQLSSVWNKTNIRGKDEYMYKPPEFTEGVPGMDPDWANDQLKTQMSKFLGKPTTKSKVQQGKFTTVGSKEVTVVDPKVGNLLDRLVSVETVKVDGKTGYVPIFFDPDVPHRSGAYVEMDPESDNYLQTFTYFPDFSSTEPGIAEQKRKEDVAERKRILDVKADKRIEMFEELKAQRGDRPMTDDVRRAMEGLIEDRLSRMEDRGEL